MYIVAVLLVLYLIGDQERYEHPVVGYYSGASSMYASYFGEDDVNAYFYHHNSVDNVSLERNVGKIYYMTEQEFACPDLDSEYVSLSNSSTDQMKTTFTKLNLY
jgi:hypothetical protein